MPSKIQLDENLWFLYVCLQKSDMKSIDFAAVGLATSLKPPAARMRYTRLRRQIESGTLIGTHGTPFLSSPSFSTSSTSPPSIASHHRSSSNNIEKEKDKKRKRDSREAERVKGLEIGPSGKGEEKIKQEYPESDEFESMSEGWDSEDEVPLAKLRKSVQVPPPPPPPAAAAAAGHHGYIGSGFAGGNGNANGNRSGNTREYGAVQRRYVPVSESRAWSGMIPAGNVGVESAYPAYWGGFSGGGWEPDEKPRKSV